MTSPRPRPGRVAAAALTAAAALAASALGVAIAAPAHAEEAPYDFQASAFPNDADYWLAGAAAGEPQSGYFYANPLLDGDEPVADFRATLSVPGDLGITLTTEDEHCVSDGSALICDYADTTTGAEVEFDLVHDGAISVGQEVEYTISITADEYDTVYISDVWYFSSEDSETPEYDVEATSYTDVEPGAELDPEVAFANYTTDSYQGLYFSFSGDDDFISFAADYSNCGTVEWGEIVCQLPDFTAEPGVVYELDPSTPVTVTLGEDAPGPMTYRAWFSAMPDVYYAEEIEFFDADEEIAFVESDRESVDGWGLMEIDAVEHLYDLAVTDQTVASSTLAIPVGNNGPASAFARQHPGSGEGDFAVSVQLPTGVTIGATDEGMIDGGSYFCAVADEFEWFDEIDPAVYGVERLDVQCWIYDTIAADGAVEIELPVVIADNAKADDGLVVANLDTAGWDFSEFEENWDLSEEDYPVLDADLENNSAKLSVGTGSGSGQLPVTGSALTITLSAAAAALIAGAVLFVLRRRKAAANW
ncbi:LPXTG cell wall anchor domain-containing protein [Glycomyces sp. NPDC048151]|uniref:LPXTG cell wall anchor domain-containing protein n=1 Tax=Glycomyces sp. NPDC048151 TaxID=3364002 RepID=UPI0037177169